MPVLSADREKPQDSLWSGRSEGELNRPAGNASIEQRLGIGEWSMLGPWWALNLETEKTGMSGLGEVSMGWVGLAQQVSGETKAIRERSTPSRQQSEERQRAGPHGESGMGNKEHQEVT